MKKTILFGISAVTLLVSSCGGSGTEGEEHSADTTVVENEVVEPVVTDFTVDTATTIVNWNNLNGEEVDHAGTVATLQGSIQVTTTGEESVITGGDLVIDMNSISEGSEKLEGHLKAEDFFDVNNYATTEFMFDRHEEGMVYGTVSIIGKEMPIEAPVEVMMDGDNVTLEVGQFELDFTALEMPFFVTEMEEAPEEERHNPLIQFSATVKGMK